MKLYWIRYQSSGTAPKYILIVPLGMMSGKLCCLDADNLTNDEKDFIRAKADDLDQLELADKVKFLKRLKPNIMRCCKTIKAENFSILEEYPIEKP
jgi:hypothetical protein